MWNKVLAVSLSGAFWGIAAGVVLPARLSTMGPHILALSDTTRYTWYAIGAGVPAALISATLSLYLLRPRQTWRSLALRWLGIGIGAGMGAIAGGSFVFAMDQLFKILPTYRAEEYGGWPAWIGLPMILIVFWALGFLSASGIAAIYSTLLALLSFPFLLAATSAAGRFGGAHR